MALRLLDVGLGRPTGMFVVDPTVEFQAGMIGGLTTIGGDIVCTVSDGATIQPMGIIDDIKAQSFLRPSTNEAVIIAATNDGNDKAASSVSGVLDHATIVESSFISDVDVVLNYVNGIITVPAGTDLNYDNDSDNVYDSILVTCSYTYEVSDLPGDDTTLGSGKVTVWYSRGFFATDQYDTTVSYTLNATLYCGSDGKLTSTSNGPGIAMVTAPPSALIAELQFLWF